MYHIEATCTRDDWKRREEDVHIIHCIVPYPEALFTSSHLFPQVHPNRIRIASQEWYRDTQQQQQQQHQPRKTPFPRQRQRRTMFSHSLRLHSAFPAWPITKYAVLTSPSKESQERRAVHSSEGRTHSRSRSSHRRIGHQKQPRPGARLANKSRERLVLQLVLDPAEEAPSLVLLAVGRFAGLGARGSALQTISHLPTLLYASPFCRDALP